MTEGFTPEGLPPGSMAQSPMHTGSGNQNVYYGEQTNTYEGGRKALDERLYPQAIAGFKGHLSSTKVHGKRLPGNAALVRDAEAHGFIALAMLNGTAPNYRSPEDMTQLQRHVESALYAGRSAGGTAQVVVWVSVLWEVAAQDWYEADGMGTPKLSAEPVYEAVALLDEASTRLLVTHMRGVNPSRSPTWYRLTQHAATLGLPPDTEILEVLPHVPDPQRADGVRRYFTRTPATVSPNRHRVAAASGLALVVAGLTTHSTLLTMLCLIGAARIGLKAYQYLRSYRAYLAAYAWAEPKPTDADMDRWLELDVDYISMRAAQRLRLNPAVSSAGTGGDLVFPLQVVVGAYEPERPAEARTPDGRFASAFAAGAVQRTHTRLGRDGMLRADRYDVLILFLTDRLISTYRGLLDVGTGNLLMDWAREFHYRDIVTVASMTRPVQRTLESRFDIDPALAVGISHEEHFELTLTAGDPLHAMTGFASAGSPSGNGKIAWDNQRALPIIQRMVRARHSTDAGAR